MLSRINPSNQETRNMGSVSSAKLHFSVLYPGLSASVILGGLDTSKYLDKLLSYLDPVLVSSQRSRFVRCWHAKIDGSAASIFHSNCDGKGPTVTIIKYGSYIFGGYTDVSWYSSKYYYHFSRREISCNSCRNVTLRHASSARAEETF